MKMNKDTRAYNNKLPAEERRDLQPVGGGNQHQLAWCREQDMAWPSGVVHWGQSRCRVQQAERLHPSAFLERARVRREGFATRREFQGGRSTIHFRRADQRKGLEALAGKSREDPVGLQEHREAQRGTAEATMIGRESNNQ
jgi:ribosomal protein L34